MLEQLQRAGPDLLRSMLTAFMQALMSADADSVCGAEFGSRSPDRTNRRNGYPSREWETRAATIELAISKLREGTSASGPAAPPVTDPWVEALAPSFRHSPS